MVELQTECWVAGKLDVGSCHLARGMKRKREDPLVGPAKVQQVRGVPVGIPSKLHVGHVRVEGESALIVERHAKDRDADSMAASVPDKVLMAAVEVDLHCGFSVEWGCCHQP